MEERDMEIFRLKIRISILEQLVVQLVLVAPATTTVAGIAANRQHLSSFLTAQTEQLSRHYGEALQDPALTALYADEVLEIERSWRKILQKLQ